MSKHVLFMSPHEHLSRYLQIELRRYGLHLEVVTEISRGLALAHHSSPDCIIIAGEFSDMNTNMISCMLSAVPETRHIPIIPLELQPDETLLETQIGAEATPFNGPISTQRLVAVLKAADILL